jgi:hypothetical protein
MHLLARNTAAALALCAAAASLPAGPVEDGEEALRAGRPELAMKFFKIAVQQNPDDARAWSGYTAATKATKGDASAALPSAPSVPEPSAPVAPIAPVSDAIPVADPASDSASETVADPEQIATSYLKGKPIFYAEGLKKLIRGRRVTNKKVSERTYEQEKERLSRYYTRKKGGKLGISATLFSPRLYAYLAALRASKEKLGPEGGVEIWEKEADKSFRLIEFYVVFKNLSYKGGIHARHKLTRSRAPGERRSGTSRRCPSGSPR